MSKKENQLRIRLNMLVVLLITFGLIPLAIVLVTSYLGPRLPLAGVALQTASETPLVDTALVPELSETATLLPDVTLGTTTLPIATVSRLDNLIIVGEVPDQSLIAFLGDTFALQPDRTDWQWQVVSYTPGLVPLPFADFLPQGFIFQAVALGPQQIVLASNGVPCNTPATFAEVSTPCSPIPVQRVVDIQVNPVPPTIPPEPTYTPFPTPDADIVVDTGKLIRRDTQTFTLLVGQTIALLRPSNNLLWEAESGPFLEALTPPEKMRNPGAEGWLFRAVEQGSTGVFIRERYVCDPLLITPIPTSNIAQAGSCVPELEPYEIIILIEIQDPNFNPEP